MAFVVLTCCDQVYKILGFMVHPLANSCAFLEDACVNHAGIQEASADIWLMLCIIAMRPQVRIATHSDRTDIINVAKLRTYHDYAFKDIAGDMNTIATIVANIHRAF